MNIYNEDGYLDIPKLVKLHMPFNFIIGGRGTGKTYGILEYIMKRRIPSIFMRSLKTQLDQITIDKYNPFQWLNADYKKNIIAFKNSANSYEFYDSETGKNGKPVRKGDCICDAIALSSIANVTGFSAVDKQIAVYDEFIPQPQERRVKQQGFAFASFAETTNRNRELKGMFPIQNFLLANAFDLAADVLCEFKLVQAAENMVREGKEVYIDRTRGVLMIIITDSPISEAKSDTALYRALAHTRFYDFAIGNKFLNINFQSIRPHHISEYIPVCSISEICIYRHKTSNPNHGGYIYVTYHHSGSYYVYGTSEIEKKRFIHDNMWIWREYIYNRVHFESYYCLALFEKYFDKKN